jgi:hypothetical protein
MTVIDFTQGETRDYSSDYFAVLLLIGAVPLWPHSRNWGYGPSGGLGWSC